MSLSVPSLMIPVAPLVHAVERAGLGPKRGSDGRMIPDSSELAGYGEHLKLAEEAGEVDLYWADDFIVTVMRCHPQDIYPEWFEYDYDAQEIEAVLDIRAQRRAGVPKTRLAAQYGVHHRVITKIETRQTWDWLNDETETAASAA